MKTGNHIPDGTFSAIQIMLKATGNTLTDLSEHMNTNIQPQDEFMKIRDVAHKLKVSPDTVKRHLKKGHYPKIKLDKAKNGAVRIKWADVQKWLTSKEM